MILVASFSLLGCEQDKQEKILTIKSDNLEIQAVVGLKLRKMNEKQSKLEGKITVKNSSSDPAFYGNKYLILQINKSKTSRTYKKIIASVEIDVTKVEIKPESSISLPVYWVFEVPGSYQIDDIELIYMKRLPAT